MFEKEHPARRAALLSREYVHTKNREGWLGLYAQDAIIQDPIGISPIDPEGKGHRGPSAPPGCRPFARAGRRAVASVGAQRG